MLGVVEIDEEVRGEGFMNLSKREREAKCLCGQIGEQWHCGCVIVPGQRTAP